MCLGGEGHVTVVKSSGLLSLWNANDDFTKSCLNKRILSTSISERALELHHASVSLHNFATIFVTCLYTGVYQSTDEGVTWLHIVPRSNVPPLHRFYFTF
jgi:hypothetical protein